MNPQTNTDGTGIANVRTSDELQSRNRARAVRRTISSPYLYRQQRRHFLFYDVMPFIGTVVASTAVMPPSTLDLWLLFTFWGLTGIGLSVGHHRLFCHRSFKTKTWVRVGLVILGCMAARSSMITWACQHRRHHQLADREGDVHSPNLHGATLLGRLRGWAHAHFLWIMKHEYPNLAYYGPDLLADRAAAKTDRYYSVWIWLGLAMPALIGGAVTQSAAGAVSGFLWGGLVRMFLVAQQVSALNSFNHLIGSKPFKLENNSRNNFIAGVLTWGEGWHNNHHAAPNSASFSCTWYQLDPGFWVIRGLEWLGLAWDVKRMPSERLKDLEHKIDDAETMEQT
jgi:stearoyl-CoA desaturase (Delta-9 desaturase)